MPLIELPNGESAVLKNRDEVTERIARRIDRSYVIAQATAMKLVASGLDAQDATTWEATAGLTEEDYNRLDGYQAELIVGLVKTWSYSEAPTFENIFDVLTRPSFEALAKACSDIYNDVPEFSPDGVTDPLVDTVD